VSNKPNNQRATVLTEESQPVLLEIGTTRFVTNKKILKKICYRTKNTTEKRKEDIGS